LFIGKDIFDRRKLKKIFVFFLVAMITMTLVSVGCSSSDHEASNRAANEVGAIWGVDHGEQNLDHDVKGGVGGSWTESHRMMAVMILSGAGMNTDFEAYDEVFLVDVATKDGSNTARVVVVEKDGIKETIIPQAIKDQGTIK
jgi:hypothetical protein